MITQCWYCNEEKTMVIANHLERGLVAICLIETEPDYSQIREEYYKWSETNITSDNPIE
jgi:hypothetical protein